MASSESWKTIPGNNGRYAVSTQGRIKNIKTGRYLKPSLNGGGYYHISLRSNGVTQHKLLHRIIAEAFIPNPNGYPEINHIDFVRTNCSIDNLEWCTHKMNMQHAGAAGHMVRWKRKLTKREYNRIRKYMNNQLQTENVDSRTFAQIYASLSDPQQDTLRYELMRNRCTKTPQTIWNWANNKRRPAHPMVQAEVARIVSKIIGAKCYPRTLFPA